MVVLIAIILPLNSLLLITYLRQRLSAATDINNLMSIIYVCIGAGIYFDCYRILSLIYFRYVDIYILATGFVLKIALLFFSLIAILQVIITYNDQIGLKLKYGELFRSTYIVLFVIFIFFNIPTHIDIPGIEFGYSAIIMNPYLFSIIPIVGTPLIIYQAYGLMKVIKEIKQRKLKIQLLSLGVIFILLLLERYYYNLAYYFGYYNYIFVNLGDLIANCALLIGYIVVIIEDPSVLDTISNYFAIRAFYIIKDNGQTIFGHKFQKNEEEEHLGQDELMLGGFIYTIASGLAHTLKTEKKVKKIKVKGTTLLLKYGKKIFGLLIISDLSKSIQKKFDLLMKKFEDTYQDELEHWTGEISKFDKKTIENWIEEIFRIC